MESSFNLYDEATIKKNIQDLASQVEQEEEKNTIDKEKIMKLRFAQLMQGLYLQTF